MLQKTRGIVFRFVRYGETSIIVSIFTEQLGLRSYIVNGVRKPSAKSKIALYQPLTLLDLVVYHKETSYISRIKEAQCVFPYKTLGADIRKSTITLFLTEVINKVVKEQSHPEEIFTFLYDSFIALDQLKDHFENFHLLFLLHLAHHLGFGAGRVEELLTVQAATEAEEKLLNKMLKADYETPIALTQDQRRFFLDVIIRYYQEHSDHMGTLKSIPVLRELLR